MALAQRTDIIFLDEPTTYLDICHQLEILELVQKLNKEQGCTIVMVLHDINQAILLGSFNCYERWQYCSKWYNSRSTY